jgi:hypothetical protein
MKFAGIMDPAIDFVVFRRRTLAALLEKLI